MARRDFFFLRFSLVQLNALWYSPWCFERTGTGSALLRRFKGDADAAGEPQDRGWSGAFSAFGLEDKDGT